MLQAIQSAFPRWPDSIAVDDSGSDRDIRSGEAY